LPALLVNLEVFGTFFESDRSMPTIPYEIQDGMEVPGRIDCRGALEIAERGVRSLRRGRMMLAPVLELGCERMISVQGSATVCWHLYPPPFMIYISFDPQRLGKTKCRNCCTG
jgi:hypothetical protein